MLQAPPTADTREALLASARRLFARRGYDGTSIRAITADAGANLGAVTYHFGSKRALYVQVLEQVLAPMPGRVAGALDAPGTPVERLEGAVRVFFQQLEENPDQPMLILQEIAAGKSAPPPVLRILRAVLTRISAVVEEGQRDGSIRPGSPMLFVLSLLSQPVYMSLATRLVPPDEGVSWTDPWVRSAAIDHAVAFIRSGLAPHSPA